MFLLFLWTKRFRIRHISSHDMLVFGLYKILQVCFHLSKLRFPAIILFFSSLFWSLPYSVLALIHSMSYCSFSCCHTVLLSYCSFFLLSLESSFLHSLFCSLIYNYLEFEYTLLSSSSYLVVLNFISSYFIPHSSGEDAAVFSSGYKAVMVYSIIRLLNTTCLRTSPLLFFIICLRTNRLVYQSFASFPNRNSISPLLLFIFYYYSLFFFVSTENCCTSSSSSSCLSSGSCCWF